MNIFRDGNKIKFINTAFITVLVAGGTDTGTILDFIGG
jgi:hypothetical protein